MRYQIKIYKIVNNIDDKVYIGSTKQPLYKRFNQHVRTHRSENNNIGRCTTDTMFEEHGVENCKIILIEEYIVDNKEQQLKHERFHYDMYLDRIVNKYRPYATKDELKEGMRKYFQTDKAKLTRSRRIVCNCGSVFIGFDHKARHERTKKHLATMSIINDVNNILCRSDL
jgi:hypothetical protein